MDRLYLYRPSKQYTRCHQSYMNHIEKGIIWMVLCMAAENDKELSGKNVAVVVDSSMGSLADLTGESFLFVANIIYQRTLR